jgi:predicted kinase
MPAPFGRSRSTAPPARAGTKGTGGVPVSASRTIMNVPAGPLIVLTGPPGAGKTTVARLVADALDPAVHLPADEYWRFIRTGYIAPWRAESQDQNAIVIDALSSGAVTYAAGGYHVVLDGIIGPWFLNRLLARARTGHVDVHYVILRPAQTVAAQRILGRPEDELSGRHQAIAAERPDDPGAAARMYQEFSALGPYEKHAIDSSAMSAEETAEVVRQLVATGQLQVCHR